PLDSLLQDAAQYSMEELVSQLSQPDNEVLEREMFTGDENENIHLELQRSVGGTHNPPMTRKPGCKNFFWKTKTAC
ncbi:SMS protein, partial [Amia calva]|nr:SMS protein [Amia calva]